MPGTLCLLLLLLQLIVTILAAVDKERGGGGTGREGDGGGGGGHLKKCTEDGECSPGEFCDHENGNLCYVKDTSLPDFIFGVPRAMFLVLAIIAILFVPVLITACAMSLTGRSLTELCSCLCSCGDDDGHHHKSRSSKKRKTKTKKKTKKRSKSEK